MLLSTILTLVVHIVLNLVALIWQQEGEKAFMTNTALATLNYLALGLNLIFVSMIVYLLAFHEFLMRNNRTTFAHL